VTHLIPIALLSLLLVAATATSAGSDDARKRALALEVMALTGANDVGDGLAMGLLAQMRPAYPSVPEEVWNDLAISVSPKELIDLALPIYLRNFSEEELAELVAFYKSRLGRTIIERMPIVMHESNTALGQWNETKIMEIYEKLKAAGYEPKST
jgi:hypothetical protein